MRCLYCGTPLAIMRMLANGSYCCDEHQVLNEQEIETPRLAAPVALERPAPRRRAPGVRSRVEEVGPESQRFVRFRRRGTQARPCAIDRAPAIRLTAEAKQSAPALMVRDSATGWRSQHPTLPDLPGIRASSGAVWPVWGGSVSLIFQPESLKANRRVPKSLFTPLPFGSKPVVPALDIPAAPLRRPAPQQELKAAQTVLPTLPRGGLYIDLSSQKLREIWRNAPGDLKIIGMVIPMILLLTLNAACPRLYTGPVSIKASAQPNLDSVFSRKWQAFRKTIAQRAGVDLVDDFRSGLDAWTLGAGLDAKWSYDRMGFVRPGSLALFRPTIGLTDYDVDFIARIEQKGLGFVFRASGVKNYQAVKLVITHAGPLPDVRVIHYTVVNGRETGRSDKPLPIQLAADSFFEVHIEVRGNDFTLMVQDKMADFWSDSRLKTGGVGFFCGKGESARVRRVEVTHQNDALGRFCAYIASDSEDNNNGS